MAKYEELIRGLKQGTVLPLYLFFGDETFLIDQAVDLVVRTTVEPASRDFNFDTVYCKGASGADLVGLCQTLPFMAGRRLVIAREIEALKAADLAELTAYLQSPSPSTCLVMIANQAKYDKKAVVKAVEEHGAAVRFFPLLDREMLPWIDARVRDGGRSIQRDAAQYVWQALGNDLQAISNELEKVAVSLRDRKTITLDDVRTVVGDFREYTAFDLAEAVGRRNAEKALMVLGRLMQEGEQPVAVLGSIAWNLRRVLRAKSLIAAGVGFEEIKKKLNIIFHQAAAFQDQMRSSSERDLVRAFGVLLEADRALKSGGMHGRLVLERAILRLCGVG